METAARTSGCALNRLERHKVRRWQERLMRKTCCIRVVPITHYPLPIPHYPWPEGGFWNPGTAPFSDPIADEKANWYYYLLQIRATMEIIGCV